MFPRLLRPALAATLLLASTTAAHAQTTFGAAPIARGFRDSFTSFISVIGQPFTPAVVGQQLTSTTVFGGMSTNIAFGSNVGLTYTPLLVSIPAGGSFSILGVGTTRTIAAGVQTWDFGLTAGTDLIDANTAFAVWHNGVGALHYDQGGPMNQFTQNLSVGTVSVGQSFNVNVSAARTYSIQWTVGQPSTVVPEPSTYALLAGGLSVLAVVRHRRRHA